LRDKENKLLDKETELSKKENLLLQQQQQQASVTAASTSQESASLRDLEKKFEQQLKIEREGRLRLEQQQIQLEHQIHRLRDTATATSVVGHNVLDRAIIDSTASFLPSLPIAATQICMDALPPGVNQSLHQRITSPRSDENHKDSIERVTEGDEDDEDNDEHEVQESANNSSAPHIAKPKSKEKKKNPEELLQQSYNILLPHLLTVLPSFLHFHDTHVRGYLTCPTGKIDVTFTASGILTWPNVVTFLEFKHSLLPKPAYEEAVGQVIQRCYDVFDKQDQRQFIVAAVMDGVRIDVFHVTRHAPLQVTHTGLQPFALSLGSVGWKLLVRLLCAPINKLGFVAPLVPETFSLPPEDMVSAEAGVKSSLRHKKFVSDFTALRIGSFRISAVYQAKCALWSKAPIVIKFSPHEIVGQPSPSSVDEVSREATVLRQLQTGHNAQCPYIPRLLAHGVHPHPIQHLHHYLIIQPYGEHLPLSGDASLVCRVMQHVCEAMRFAYVQHGHLLHRDISYGNIIHADGVGYLIDWHVAYPLQSTPFTDRITGTPLFSSHRLHLRNHTHCLMDDLESLLYVMIYVATGGWLPWVHAPPKLMDALKKWHLTEPEPFQEVLERCSLPLRSVIAQLRSIIFSSASTLLSLSSPTADATSSPSSSTPSIIAFDDAAVLPLLQFLEVLQKAEMTMTEENA